MKLKKLCTAFCLTTLLALPSLCLADTPAGAEETKAAPDQRVVLTLGSNEALLNDVPYRLDVPPEVVDGTTFLPIRFVAEKVLDAAVKWEPTTKEIELAQGDIQVKLSLEAGQALVNDQAVEITSPPFVKDGRTLVPLRFLAENFNMQVEYNHTDKTITLTKARATEQSPVNMPPVITSLGLQKDEIKIGETPHYFYTYDNEPGEAIVAEEWFCRFVGDSQAVSGKPRAFFRPGEYILSLRIKDAAGKWSETATARFTVSDEVLISEREFKFTNPLYGELYENAENVNFNRLPANENTGFEFTGPVLHISNSPEVVTQPGILYQSEASGDFRLFYHHLNGFDEKQYLYVIVENKGTRPVTLKTLKSGVGGPTQDYMSLGQTVSMRYLSSASSSTVTIKPGEKIILNQGLRHLNKGEAVTGMQDFWADGTVTISVVMGPENPPQPEPVPEQEPEETEGNTEILVEPIATSDTQKTPQQLLEEKIDYLLSLPALPARPPQIRGVFPSGDCLVTIRANGESMEKVILGKEERGFDSWLEGMDPLTGDAVNNIGNYGVVYRVKVSSPVKTGILLNPRGSIFKGAFRGFDGNVYQVPKASFFIGNQKAAVLGVLQAGQTAEFVYTPPSGSDTPLVLALIPEQFWTTAD